MSRSATALLSEADVEFLAGYGITFPVSARQPRPATPAPRHSEVAARRLLPLITQHAGRHGLSTGVWRIASRTMPMRWRGQCGDLMIGSRVSYDVDLDCERVPVPNDTVLIAMRRNTRWELEPVTLVRVVRTGGIHITWKPGMRSVLRVTSRELAGRGGIDCRLLGVVALLSVPEPLD